MYMTSDFDYDRSLKFSMIIFAESWYYSFQSLYNVFSVTLISLEATNNSEWNVLEFLTNCYNPSSISRICRNTIDTTPYIDCFIVIFPILKAQVNSPILDFNITVDFPVNLISFLNA